MISPSKTFNQLYSYFSRVRIASALVVASLSVVGIYAITEINAHQTGISGQTEKNSSGPSAGCWCHCPSPSSATTVTLTSSSGTSPLTVSSTTPINFTATVANSNGTDNFGGIDIATYSGEGLHPDVGLIALNTELTHDSPQSFTGGSTSWNFLYTPSSSTGWDTIYATGNATNGNGNNGNGDCSDNWNNAQKFIIHVVGASKRLTMRSAVPMGSVRVGHRKADSLLVSSYGGQAITIASSLMKSGIQFVSSPAGANRTINAGATEMDSIIFAPTARGSFSDSAIYTTNSDDALQTRIAVYTSGQGIQAALSYGSTTGLNFGNVRINNTKSFALHYSNTGDDTLVLTANPTINGTGFTITQQPHSLSLAPGQSDSVVIRFAPMSKILYSASISFSAADGVTISSANMIGYGIGPTFSSASLLVVGSIRVNKTLTSSVQFRNAGTDTLHISAVTLTPSGSKFTVVSFDPFVLPNSLGTVHISYSPTAETNDTALIHFSTDDASNLSPIDTVIGFGTLPHMALADFNKTPSLDTVDFGTIRVYDVQERPFVIQNAGSDALHVTSFTAGPAPFYTKTGVDSVKAGSSDFVVAKFSPTTAGTFTGSLTIGGDDPKTPTSTVYLKGTAINSSMIIRPATVDFGTIRVNSMLLDTITLSNSSTTPIKILGYTLDGFGGIFNVVDSSAKTVPANGSAHVVVSFSPPSTLCYTGTLTLKTDESTAPVRTIGVTGCGEQGVLSMNPPNIDFLDVDSGKSSRQTAEFHNTGVVPLKISSITFSGSSDFSYSSSGLPVTIIPGGFLPLDVIFTPTCAACEESALLVSHLDDGTTVSLQLSGYGSTPSLFGSVAGAARPVLGLTLSPNPARDLVTLHLTLPESSSLDVHVFDRAGREIRVTKLGNFGVGDQSASISTEELPSGAYFVRVLGTNGEHVTSRLVIER